MEAIYLFYESDAWSSVSKRVLIGVCTDTTLEGMMWNIEQCGDFTDNQYNKLMDIDFHVGDPTHDYCWNIGSDNNDRSLFIASYPAKEVTFDLGGIE